MWQIEDKLKEVLTYSPDAPMIFSSGLFLFLFLGFCLVYMLLQKRDTARLLFVSAFSYYFYYKSSGFYFFLLGVVTVVDFLVAGWIGRTQGKIGKRFLLFISLGVNLGLLCYFKYTNFFYQMLVPLWDGTFTPLDIFLPVGISFFTFQSLSYTIDVYRGNLKPLHRLLDYVFYVSFFPQLVAGPIVRAKDFIPQIRQPLFVSREMFGQGVFFIVCGLFKKAVISDYISINFVERIFDNPGLYSGLENLMGVYGYALQIYCDFSGYSDMAIGIA
ncbi:MAG: MBOAT family O-acyltransferase, partial [Bacteroides sp.]